jgi:hypothetical protein
MWLKPFNLKLLCNFDFSFHAKVKPASFGKLKCPAFSGAF